MTDPYDLSDILLGRIDVLRSNVDAIVEEFAKWSNDRNNGSEKEESFEAVLKNRLDRAAQNMQILGSYGPKFEAQTNALEDVGLAQRNMLLEYRWKREAQEKGIKASHIFRQQLGYRFPNLEQLGNDATPPPPPSFFTPRPSKRARIFNHDLDKLPLNLDGILVAITPKNSSFSFYKSTVKAKGGRKLITGIKVEVNKEMTVYISFNPSVPQNGPSGDVVGSVSASPSTPMTPSTPSSPASGSGRSRLNTRKAPKSKRTTKKKNDMATKAKQAAEEANRIEQDELMARAAAAREAAREKEAARQAGVQVTNYIERVSIVAFGEKCPRGAWGDSEYMIFRKISQHAREAMYHFGVHFPETSLRHFFAWIDSFNKIYDTPCSVCKKILAKDSDEMYYLPPSFRDYSNGKAYHPRCLPV